MLSRSKLRPALGTQIAVFLNNCNRVSSQTHSAISDFLSAHQAPQRHSLTTLKMPRDFLRLFVFLLLDSGTQHPKPLYGKRMYPQRVATPLTRSLSHTHTPAALLCQRQKGVGTCGPHDTLLYPRLSPARLNAAPSGAIKPSRGKGSFYTLCIKSVNTTYEESHVVDFNPIC